MFARKLLTVEDFNPGGVLAVLRSNWPSWEPFNPPTDVSKLVAVTLDTGQSVLTRPTAVVNHGRWIAHCPLCNGAQLASKVDTRFFCIDCFHAEDPASMGKWLQVKWPDAETIRQIEDALLIRPQMDNRNWHPDYIRNKHLIVGESTIQLRGENAAFLTDHLVGKVFE